MYKCVYMKGRTGVGFCCPYGRKLNNSLLCTPRMCDGRMLVCAPLPLVCSCTVHVLSCPAGSLINTFNLIAWFTRGTSPTTLYSMDFAQLPLPPKLLGFPREVYFHRLWLLVLGLNGNQSCGKVQTFHMQRQKHLWHLGWLVAFIVGF